MKLIPSTTPYEGDAGNCAAHTFYTAGRMAVEISILGVNESRSIENPSTPLSAPDDWLGDALGAFKSSSGVRVNRETALTYSAIWKGTNLISGDTGKLPLYLDHVGPKGRRRALEHPAYKLLRHKPNANMTASIFKKTLQGHALLDGNGYAYIQRNGAGQPLELWPLLPRQVVPVRVNGQLWYVYDFLDGDRRKIPSEDVLHIKGFSYDGLIGYNMIHKARESIGWAMAMQTYGSVFFRNNATPRVVLEAPHRVSPAAQENLRMSWERLHAGLENAHRTAVLEDGMKASVLSINASDAQLVEQMKFSYIDVANWLCLPPHKVGGDGRTAYASLEQENQAYLDDCLDGWLVGWEEECWDKLLTEDEKESGEYEVRFSRRELLRANLDARGSFYVQMMQWGVFGPDDVRSEEGLNPQENDVGKVYYRPLNMSVVDAVTGEIKAMTPTKDDPIAEPVATVVPAVEPAIDASRATVVKAVGMMLKDAVARMVKRIGHQAERAATDCKKFGEWLDGIGDNNGQAIRESLHPAETAIVGLGHEGNIGNWLIEQLVSEYTALTERCTPRELPSQAAALSAALSASLPKVASEKFLRQGEA